MIFYFEMCPFGCMFFHLAVTSFMLTGLIAAVCGQLEVVLQNNDHVSSVVPKTIVTSNGQAMMKAHQNGNATKHSNGLVNGVYSNGNGVHF